MIMRIRDNADQAIKAVRDWLAVAKAGVGRPPGGAAIGKRYVRFTAEWPAICAAADLETAELTSAEYADMASTWLRRELRGALD